VGQNTSSEPQGYIKGEMLRAEKPGERRRDQLKRSMTDRVSESQTRQTWTVEPSGTFSSAEWIRLSILNTIPSRRTSEEKTIHRIESSRCESLINSCGYIASNRIITRGDKERARAPMRTVSSRVSTHDLHRRGAPFRTIISRGAETRAG
jgi:hypothetical protein